jgi:aspartate racemase
LKGVQMHKKIGILGGLSPESTVSYYLYITRTYTERFGDYGYPDILIYSVSLEKYHQWRARGQWDRIAEDLIHAARTLENAGADLLILATNTMHLVFDQLQAAVRTPFIHIIDATVRVIKAGHYSTVGLLGTKSTMSEAFFRDRLATSGITALVPDDDDQDTVHEIIVNELVRGQIREDSRQKYLEIINRLAKRGAEGIILGCTEIPLLINQSHCALPLFDTTEIHAEAALQFAVVQPKSEAGDVRH